MSTDQFLVLGDIITCVGISAIIGLADRVLGTDSLIIKSVSSIVTVEARYDAFFRHADDKVPNPTSHGTVISSIRAYNLALPFVVRGSCPVEIPILILLHCLLQIFRETPLQRHQAVYYTQTSTLGSLSHAGALQSYREWNLPEIQHRHCSLSSKANNC
jgi:hypothetical protein